MAGIDQYTKLMLHCNGTDGSTTFPDDSDSAHTVTANGNAQVDTAQSVFGGASGLFDGNDYLSIPDSDDFYLNSDFTIDFRIRWNGSVGESGIVGQSQGGGGQPKWAIYGFVSDLGMGSSLGLHISTGSDIIFDTWIPSTDTWYHVEIDRSGNNFYLFVNGTKVGSTKTSSISFPNVSAQLRVGMDGEGYKAFNGWIDEFRFSNGIARHTSDFTPPSEEYTKVPTLNIEETITLADTWNIFTNPEVQNIEETIILDDEWLIQSNPEQEQIDEIIIIDDSWNISTIEYSHFASKIISYNPLIYVTNSNPAKIIKVDITDPENPIKYTYEIISNSYAKDIVFNSTNDYFYVVCADGKVVKINKNDLEDQTEINTLDTDILQNIDTLDASLISYISTDDSNGEIILLDEREVKKINTDLRIAKQNIKQINTRLNLILGKLINTDLRLRKINSKIINTDLRILSKPYVDINKYPISYTDWEVYINGTELTVLDDVDMNSILITHDITQEEEKASQAQFVLNRRHDKLNYTNTGASNQITNQNQVIIKIKGHTEFTGKISNITSNSEIETVNVIAIGSRPSDKRHSVTIPIPSVDEQLNLYHCLINNVSIDNPYIAPNDENPEYYKGIQVDLGTEIEQNILRYSAILNITTLAEKIENGEFTPKQNWTYFWFAKATNFITGLTWGTLRYLGTSLASLSADTWQIVGVSYKYQKELDDTETELGLYQIGNAPYDEISVKNGKFITKDKWIDKRDGMYLERDEGYDYTEYAKRVVDLEYQKLLNISGQILPKTDVIISLSIDAYYYYNIDLLTRINVTNTTTSNIYNNQNGFPVAVKNIRIQCSTEGENSMIVELTCDNQKSQLELEEIDEQYPDENSDEFIFEEESAKIYSKFDPNTWGYPA